MPRDLHDYLDRVSGLVRSEMRHAASRAGLELVQLEGLRYLTLCNRFSDTPSAVAEYLGLTRGTVSQSLRALEVKGLIVKEADAADRRVTHCRPTTAGRKLVNASYPARSMTDVAAREPDATTEAKAALRELLQIMQIAGEHRTFGQCRTCSHLLLEGERFRCGLTHERLIRADTLKICREHLTPSLEHTG